MARNGSLVSATFDGTVTISVIALSNILHASCGLPEEYRNRTEGLLGEKQTGLCETAAGARAWAPDHGVVPRPVGLWVSQAELPFLGLQGTEPRGRGEVGRDEGPLQLLSSLTSCPPKTPVPG